MPILKRVQIISFGSAQVGKAPGLMNVQKRFPRPTLVILDGDQEQSEGCILLPGTDAPERQIYYGGNDLWRILCRSWVKNVLENRDDKMTIVEAIRNKLGL